MENEGKMVIERQNPRIPYSKNKYRIPRPARPQSQEPEYQAVPQWERKFCTSICKISWKKICEAQKLLYLYPTVASWNDSEAREAFENGKARYWAEINNLPCPIPLPNLDMYIDVVDHDAVLDPEQIKDLYEVPEPTKDGNDGKNNICWDSFRFTLDTVPVTGWGDDEDKDYVHANANATTQIQPTGWGNEFLTDNDYYHKEVMHNQPNGWGDDEFQPKTNNVYKEVIQIQPTGWGDEQEVPMQSNKWGEGENPSTGTNSNFNYNYSGYQHGRNYSYSRKEHGEKRYKGRKKAFCVNERESRSSWQWQKSMS